jgi:hypothetical protein
MLSRAYRVCAVAMNTYREAVGARVLLGLFALALATSAYSIVIAAMSVGQDRQDQRIVADLGTAAMSLFSVLGATALGATMLYRELELKTIFPILTRTLVRSEYLVGKYFGILITFFVFLALHGALVLAILALQAGNVVLTLGVAAGAMAILGVASWRAKFTRVYVIVPWSVALLVAMALCANAAGAERQLVLLSAILTFAEIAIVSAVAMLFSAFSSPFLTALFTIMVFVIGRSADTLGNLPARTFGTMGPWVHALGRGLAHVVPNLHLYVPARSLLLGQVAAITPIAYTARACANAALYAAILLTLGALVFRRRDFS